MSGGGGGGGGAGVHTTGGKAHNWGKVVVRGGLGFTQLGGR